MCFLALKQRVSRKRNLNANEVSISKFKDSCVLKIFLEEKDLLPNIRATRS